MENYSHKPKGVKKKLALKTTNEPTNDGLYLFAENPNSSY